MTGRRRVTIKLNVNVKNGAVLVRLVRALAVTAAAIARDVEVGTDQPDNGRLLDRALPSWVWTNDDEAVSA